MEPKPEYITPRQVSCSQCKATIGEYTEQAGKVWLRIGAVSLEYAHGRCGCGAEWHWHASDRLLERIIEYRRRRVSDNPK